MQTPISPDETVIKEGAANHQRNIEGVGGKLYLTNRRLVFEPHALNIQTGATVISLGDVAKVEPAWTKFLNLIPIIPNSIKVVSKSGEENSFVVFGRSEWMRAILDAAGKVS